MADDAPRECVTVPKKAEPPGTIRVSAREMREAAARAGGFDHLTINDVQAVVNRKTELEVGEAPKRSKYRNVRVVVDGETFDSKREAAYWHELKLREKAGEIVQLKRQVPFELLTITDDEDVVVVATYVADFVFRDATSLGSGELGALHVQDVKGGRATQTQLYKIKKKWLELQSGIVIEEV